jgi:geranylgeranyl diphosphate synthase type II
MDALAQIELALSESLTFEPGGPPRLSAAIQHAVFPGGMRVRPRLCLAVAAACGGRDRRLTEGSAAAIELLHCASLVHDDLPCFDDAATRRGMASVHAVFGAPLAVLAGDALIALSFETMVRAGAGTELLLLLARAAGTPFGLVAGQAWEAERDCVLATYQRAKTASLFSLATMTGALSAHAPAEPWRALGERLGEAYQVADDIRDVTLDAEHLGKPAGRDAALGRPSAALQHGVEFATARVEQLVRDAIDAIPACGQRDMLRTLILGELTRLLPEDLVLRAAA